MPKFIFKLQPVLDQREREERNKMLAVAELEREKLALESRIRNSKMMMDDERQTLVHTLMSGQSVDMRAVKLQAGASLKHNFDAQRTVLELAGLHQRLQSARSELAQASARKKAVELLREQQRTAFKRELDRRETNELDEMSVMRHSRDESSWT